MEKIDNYIVEKFKISKNTANNNLYRVNDEFIIDPEKDYYTNSACPALYRVAENKAADNNKSNQQQRKQNRKNACYSGKNKRFC